MKRGPNKDYPRRKVLLGELGLIVDVKWWTDKFRTLVRNAPKKGVFCDLSFDQYVRLAKRAGIKSPDEIGPYKGKFQMGRKGDIGDYTIGNCRFITRERNAYEKHKNGGVARGAIKQGLFHRGRTAATDEYVARRAEKLRGRTKENHLGVSEAARKNSKPFAFRSPTGTVYRGRGLRQFAEDHELHAPSLGDLMKGNLKHHRGWTRVLSSPRKQNSSNKELAE